jgi:hypothetical protein
MKNKLILWFVLLLVGLLAGFVPQYLKVRRLSLELTEAKQQLDSCQASLALSQLRDTAAVLYLEVTRKNYGIAEKYSGRLFGQIQQMASKTPDPTLKTTLEDILKARDRVTAALAKGDPAVVTDLQPIMTKLQEGTMR